jgi:hypothetical protein
MKCVEEYSCSCGSDWCAMITESTFQISSLKMDAANNIVDGWTTYTEPNVLGLRDSLPQSIPVARASKYGYDASSTSLYGGGSVDKIPVSVALSHSLSSINYAFPV